MIVESCGSKLKVRSFFHMFSPVTHVCWSKRHKSERINCNVNNGTALRVVLWFHSIVSYDFPKLTPLWQPTDIIIIEEDPGNTHGNRLDSIAVLEFKLGTLMPGPTFSLEFIPCFVKLSESKILLLFADKRSISQKAGNLAYQLSYRNMELAQWPTKMNCEYYCFYFIMGWHCSLNQSILVYPPGEVGALNITQRDLRRLRSGAFLNDTLVEFGLRQVLWDLFMGGLTKSSDI